MGITYKDAGVDVDAIKKSQESIGRLIRTTHNKTSIIHGFGHYAGLVEIPGNMLLATHTDGVGTKVAVANLMKKFDTVGIDCIAMNVNDVICVGATPTSFVDYIAANRNEPMIFDELIQGLSVGARQAEVPIVGGETAIMTDMFAGDDFAFDLAGTVTGLVSKDSLVLGDAIRPGDVIVGAHSSGIHSNGYTLVRNVLFPKYSIHDNIKGIGCIGDALLTPTRIYVLPVLDILQECTVHGLAHITGGSFAKLSRLANVGFEVDSLPSMPPIMELIQAQGVDDDEMYKTFNMGVGFCVILSKDQADSAISIFKRYNIESDVIGYITDSKGVRVNSHILSYIG